VNFHLGIKSDPIQYRYTFEWLFRLMQDLDLRYMQLGSFFELYSLPDRFFHALREKAEAHGVRIKSCFTAHRELGGFFTCDDDFTQVARRSYRRYVEIGGILGADYVGSNPGAVYRDRPADKPEGIRRYLEAMKELSFLAQDVGLRGLTVEPMSSAFEPPSLPDEFRHMMRVLAEHHAAHPNGTVPAYLCGDVSHGVADKERRILYDHETLFGLQIPWMAEFHFKNTDSIYRSTFGFSEKEQQGGIVSLRRIRDAVFAQPHAWPVDEVVGYLEIGGPKLGRDYSDPELEVAIRASIAAIRSVFTADAPQEREAP
jgi:ribulose-phosphate 3-epimerase